MYFQILPAAVFVNWPSANLAHQSNFQQTFLLLLYSQTDFCDGQLIDVEACTDSNTVKHLSWQIIL